MPFLFARDDQLVSGRIDRLIVERDWSGATVRAHIIDFKFERAPSESRNVDYATQMALYSEAVQRLCGVPAAQTSAQLVYLRSGSVLKF